MKRKGSPKPFPTPITHPADNATHSQPDLPWNAAHPNLIPPWKLPHSNGTSGHGSGSTQTPTQPNATTPTTTNGTSTPTTGGTSLNTNSGGKAGTGSNTWAIVGGVVGGIILLASAIFIVYRLTQRRFSALEDEGAEIRWPELNPDGQEVSANTSTLYPLGTTRTGGAGVEMDNDKSEWGDDTYTPEHQGMSAIPGRNAYLARGPTLHARQMSYGALAMQSRSEVGMSPDGYYEPTSDGLRRDPSSQGSYPPSPRSMMGYGGAGPSGPPPPVPGMPPLQYGGVYPPGPGQPLPVHSPPLPGRLTPPFQPGAPYSPVESGGSYHFKDQSNATQHRPQKPSSGSIDNYYPEFEPRADTPQHFAVTNPDRASSEVGAGHLEPQQLRRQLSIMAMSGSQGGSQAGSQVGS
ncbi:BQ2448_7490 [Microbotryum intermedium]|uniref:BQ2448_7490 protein n=1 Tax=Microbotryum intermedium TaxID=269621 RepID=A0A238FNW1_9BASI|nr:BQ2448_7490 [Microbotryum intermedium]